MARPRTPPRRRDEERDESPDNRVRDRWRLVPSRSRERPRRRPSSRRSRSRSRSALFSLSRSRASSGRGHRRTLGATVNLGELVKRVQRESTRGRELWIKFTFEEGGGIRDPTKHEPSFLQRFLDEAAKQGLSATSAKMQELVEEVKELQRNSKEGKEAWAKYCDDWGGGFMDPTRHPQEFLEDFLEQVGAGAVPRDGVAQEAAREDVQELAQKVTELERGTEEGKQCWHWWCEVEGGFSRYPDRNSAPLLRRFLDMMSTDASLASFRRKYAPTQQVVDRVKTLQRNSPEFKAKWEQHCNDFSIGTYDPHLHVSSFIEQFLDAHDRHGTSERLPPRGAARASDFEHTGRGSSSPGSARFHDLLQRVKDSQKGSLKVHKLWYWLCEAEGGNVRDPAKHDAKFLQRFLDMQGDAEDLACTRQPPEDLLQKVRDARRESSEANGMWECYCDYHAGGTLDPLLHTATFLWEFLDLIGKVDGERASSAPPPDVVVEFKQIQKKAPAWKEKWKRFCDEHGDGDCDPNHHSADFLLRFLDLATDEQHCAIAAASPQELQGHVKASIDLDSDWKKQWQRFCDDNGSPSYNPRKADSILLRRFLLTMAGLVNQFPEANSGGKAGGRDSHAEARSRSRSPGRAERRRRGRDNVGGRRCSQNDDGTRGRNAEARSRSSEACVSRWPTSAGGGRSCSVSDRSGARSRSCRRARFDYYEAPSEDRKPVILKMPPPAAERARLRLPQQPAHEAGRARSRSQQPRARLRLPQQPAHEAGRSRSSSRQPPARPCRQLKEPQLAEEPEMQKQASEWWQDRRGSRAWAADEWWGNSGGYGRRSGGDWYGNAWEEPSGARWRRKGRDEKCWAEEAAREGAKDGAAPAVIWKSSWSAEHSRYYYYKAGTTDVTWLLPPGAVLEADDPAAKDGKEPSGAWWCRKGRDEKCCAEEAAREGTKDDRKAPSEPTPMLPPDAAWRYRSR